MRKHTTTFLIIALLGASGFIAAAIASDHGLASALQTTGTTGTLATTTTTAATTTTTTTTTPPGQARKVTLCHHTHGKKGTKHVTIRVSPRAVRGHMKHGDTLGPCSTTKNKKAHKSKAHAKKWHKKGKGKGR